MSENLEAFREEVRGWIDANLPQDIRVGNRKDLNKESLAKWVPAIGEKGWLVPDWPAEYGGGGLDRKQAQIV